LVFYMPVFGFSGWVVFWRGRCSFGIQRVALCASASGMQGLRKKFLVFALHPTQPTGWITSSSIRTGYECEWWGRRGLCQDAAGLGGVYFSYISFVCGKCVPFMSLNTE
jgi:hypothetical protein